MEMIMSMTFGTSATARSRALRGGGLMGVVKTMLTVYLKRRIERAAIVQLNAMSDRELRDIGLARSEIEGAVRGEFNHPPFLR
jgi:uncharacterized protein YjiS (DUF1127 family)